MLAKLQVKQKKPDDQLTKQRLNQTKLNSFWRSLARCKHVAEQAKEVANKLRQETEKAKLLLIKKPEAKNKHVFGQTNTKTNPPVTEDELMCDHCEEEFEKEKLHREHTHSCPICNVTF